MKGIKAKPLEYNFAIEQSIPIALSFSPFK